MAAVIVGVAGLCKGEEEEDLTFSCRLLGEIKQFSLCCVSLYHCLLLLLSIWSRAGCTFSVVLLFALSVPLFYSRFLCPCDLFPFISELFPPSDCFYFTPPPFFFLTP